MTTTTAAQCPQPWCQLDHAAEPPTHHAGRIVLSADAELLVSDTPGAGLRFELIAEPGATAETAVTFGPGTAVHLAGVLARVAGS